MRHRQGPVPVRRKGEREAAPVTVLPSFRSGKCVPHYHLKLVVTVPLPRHTPRATRRKSEFQVGKPNKPSRSRGHLSWLRTRRGMPPSEQEGLCRQALEPRWRLGGGRTQAGETVWRPPGDFRELFTRICPICVPVRPSAKAKAIHWLVWADVKAQLGFTVTCIDFGPCRMSAHP